MTRRTPLAIILLLAVSAIAQSQPGSDDAVFETARNALAAGHPADAEAAISEWIRAHKRDKNPQVAEALVIYGDALTAQGLEYEALYHYERAIKDFPTTTSFAAAVNRELDIGVRYVHGLKRMADGVRSVPSEDIGEELLVRVQERLPGTQAAERACIELADYYFRAHDFAFAVACYDIFLQTFPGSAHKQHAQQRRMFAVVLRSLPGALLYGVPAAALLAFALIAPRWMRRRKRSRTGHCVKCGYDLQGLPVSAECPECGTSRRA